MIDAHTHFFPKETATNLRAWANEHKEFYWLKLVDKRPDGKPSLQGFPSEEKFIADMNDAGIRHAIIQGWYWENAQTCIEQNEAVSKFIKKYPDRLSAFASIQPNDKWSLEIAENARNMGFVGFGELHDGVQKFSFEDKIFQEILKIAERDEMPVCLHITEKSERQYLGKTPTETSKAIEIAKKHPNVKFIFAHWCGNLAIENSKEFAELPNVYFDSAATQFTAPKDIFSAVEADTIISAKAVYGSDYPLRLYPKLFKVEEMKTAVDFARGQISKNFEKNLFTNTISKVIKDV